MRNTKEKDWFDSPNIVTYLIIGILILLIILSQSFAIQNHLSTADMIRSILNHNSVYVLTLTYFVFIRFKTGKKYFDYLNALMALLYILISVASIFTIFQSFALATLVSFLLNILLLLYFVYAFICDTVLGKDLYLANSPMVELKNGQYFYLISSLLGVDLVISLIDSTSFEGVVIVLLEVMFYFLFARYIYLYKEYNDEKIEKKAKKNRKKEAGDEV